MRIVVVGPLKQGKSQFVNSLLNLDRVLGRRRRDHRDPDRRAVRRDRVGANWSSPIRVPTRSGFLSRSTN